MKIILAIIIFSFIVIFHELGHFLFAKKCNVLVNEFCLGMGPTILSWGKGETKYCLKLLPLGGACIMEGEDEGSDSDRAFTNKTAWERFQIVFGGPLFNFILAFIMAVIFIACIGVDMPDITGVMEGYAAEEAGMQAGDTIVKLGNYRVHFYKEVTVYTYFHTGESIDVTYERDGQRYTTTLVPKLDEESGRYLLGIYGNSARTRVNPVLCLAYGLDEVKYEIYLTFESLHMLFSGQAGIQDISGPVGIVSTIGDVYEESLQDGIFYVFINMLSIAILLSANLGVMNLLPIPALDGGRILMILIEVIRRKRVSVEVEGAINFAGFALLMLLMVVVMYNDIVKLL